MVRWSTVQTESDLSHWEAAWRTHNTDADSIVVPRVFPHRLLDIDHERVVAGCESDGAPIVAGLVVCRSEGVVGVSNLFGPVGRRGQELELRSSATAFVQKTCPGLPTVDYGRGLALTVAQRVGYEPIGPLRVWCC